MIYNVIRLKQTILLLKSKSKKARVIACLCCHYLGLHWTSICSFPHSWPSRDNTTHTTHPGPEKPETVWPCYIRSTRIFKHLSNKIGFRPCQNWLFPPICSSIVAGVEYTSEMDIVITSSSPIQKIFHIHYLLFQIVDNCIHSQSIKTEVSYCIHFSHLSHLPFLVSFQSCSFVCQFEICMQHWLGVSLKCPSNLSEQAPSFTYYYLRNPFSEWSIP